MASPAAEVTACCSAIPTSNSRSGKRSPNLLSPVGPGMAAVIATILRCSLATSMSASENTEVQPGAEALIARPVFGSMTPVECICSASSSSAGAYPMPLRVITCTITGPP
ncbi:Uncharacterised protein [Mycobacteroides abscessus subsp. abscessus]|nr:Uncharacterised protein [Mycobacteroides abscessus subsp. abscessus]